MKRLMKNTKYYSSILGILFLAFGVTSCEDDDLPDVPPTPVAEITASDQTISQNVIWVDEVTVDQNAWLVTKKVKEDDSFTSPIADPVLVEEGTQTDIAVQLDTDTIAIEDGTRIILQLYTDDGNGEFDDADEPIEMETGGIVSEEITVSSPAFAFVDQAVVDNTLTFESVSMAQPGFIVLHAANEDGTINEEEIMGWKYIEAGESTDVAVPFSEDATYEVGDTIFARLYVDDPADETFTYVEDTTADVPVVFGFGEDPYIYDSIVIIE